MRTPVHALHWAIRLSGSPAPIVALFLMLQLNPLNAQETRPSAPSFASPDFRAALTKVLHERFDAFLELQMDTDPSQLPGMTCRTVGEPPRAYDCQASSLSSEKADTQYRDLVAVLSDLLIGYLPCPDNPAASPSAVKQVGFCHRRNAQDAHAALLADGSIYLSVDARSPIDPGEPVQIMFAQALADLGRHKDAVKAFSAIDPSGVSSLIATDAGAEQFLYMAAEKKISDLDISNLPATPEDLLATGSPDLAFDAEEQIIDSLLTYYRKNPGQMNERNAENLALDYDLRARIEAALGKLAPALRDLDLAFRTLPRGANTTPQQAEYFYHRALILAENGKFKDASKACRDSLDLENEHTALGARRNVQCAVIDALAASPGAGGIIKAPSTSRFPHIW